MLTMRTLLSGLLLLCVGVGAGVLLIAWAGARYPHDAPKAVVPATVATAPALHAELAAAPAAIPSPDLPPAEEPAAPQVSGAQTAAQVEAPPPALPIVSGPMANQPKFQPNGLPLGMVKDPYNPEVYKKLPGVQPPLINENGRDMRAEALSMMQAPHQPVPMPGSAPQQQLQLLPFPKTLEEANAALRVQAPDNAPAPGHQ
jgi:hypothetical protein